MSKEVIVGRPINGISINALECYTKEICNLAAADGVNLKESDVRRKLAQHSLSDIERIVDAFERFGVAGILEAL